MSHDIQVDPTAPLVATLTIEAETLGDRPLRVTICGASMVLSRLLFQPLLAQPDAKRASTISRALMRVLSDLAEPSQPSEDWKAGHRAGQAQARELAEATLELLVTTSAEPGSRRAEIRQRVSRALDSFNPMRHRPLEERT